MALQLNIGCGRYPHPDYVNVDSDPTVGQFVSSLDMRFTLADAHALPFEAGAADVVYASHLVEHYPPSGADGVTVDTLLAEWRRVLAPGGRLLAAVPDLLTCASRILSEERRREMWLGMLFGYHRKPGDVHAWAYTKASLSALLERHGFEPRGGFRPFVPNPQGEGFDCAGSHCLDDLGNAIPVSLNVRARKR